MKTSYRSTISSRVLVFLAIFLGAVSAYAQPLTWDAEPFPVDSNWPGPKGLPATISANEVVLDGQPARSEQTFSGPFLFSCDVVLSAKNTTDGAFWLFLIPPSTALNSNLYNTVYFQLGYDTGINVDTTGLFRKSGPGPDTTFYSITNPLSAGVTNHVSVGVAANGALSLSLNGQAVSLPNTAVLTFGSFQMQMQGWQPNALWHVSNFAVVPEPTTVALVGLGVVGLLAGTRRNRKR